MILRDNSCPEFKSWKMQPQNNYELIVHTIRVKNIDRYVYKWGIHYSEFTAYAKH